ncbi:hypothetical protein CC86DRAFT_436835 [Ophiobolus disseminans]|uniref:Uncharacterized protein n=1 Tax=Ophiobolus disseminans TaxID=1469910 RepID=A0A6A7A7E7_9PLEO|nr:hypothetical protein CC86DRAFT_436835 [Ophiobolus disseminans]
MTRVTRIPVPSRTAQRPSTASDAAAKYRLRASTSPPRKYTSLLPLDDSAAALSSVFRGDVKTLFALKPDEECLVRGNVRGEVSTLLQDDGTDAEEARKNRLMRSHKGISLAFLIASADTTIATEEKHPGVDGAADTTISIESMSSSSRASLDDDTKQCVPGAALRAAGEQPPSLRSLQKHQPQKTAIQTQTPIQMPRPRATPPTMSYARSTSCYQDWQSLKWEFGMEFVGGPSGLRRVVDADGIGEEGEEGSLRMDVDVDVDVGDGQPSISPFEDIKVEMLAPLEVDGRVACGEIDAHDDINEKDTSGPDTPTPPSRVVNIHNVLANDALSGKSNTDTSLSSKPSSTSTESSSDTAKTGCSRSLDASNFKISERKLRREYYVFTASKDVGGVDEHTFGTADVERTKQSLIATGSSRDTAKPGCSHASDAYNLDVSELKLRREYYVYTGGVDEGTFVTADVERTDSPVMGPSLNVVQHARPDLDQDLGVSHITPEEATLRVLLTSLTLDPPSSLPQVVNENELDGEHIPAAAEHNDSSDFAGQAETSRRRQWMEKAKKVPEQAHRLARSTKKFMRTVLDCVPLVMAGRKPYGL